MVWGSWVAVLSAATAAPVLDLSALAPAVAHHPVANQGQRLCINPELDGNALAVAIVIYGRRPGRSAWGHASLRFLACDNGQLRDVEFEYYRLDNTTASWFALAHPGEHWYEDPAYMKAQANQLVVLRNDRPVDGGWYRTELLKNREITEAWMPWSTSLSTELLQAQDARHTEQLRRLRAHEDLAWLEYEAMGDNCTFHIREALGAAAGGPEGALAGSVYPMELLRVLEDTPGAQLVVHPSASALRKLERAGHTIASGAPSPLFRPVKRRPVSKRRRSALAERYAVGAKSTIVELLIDGGGALPLADGTGVETPPTP